MVDKKPVNLDTTLIQRDEVWFTMDTNKPYSGKVFSLHENGENGKKVFLKTVLLMENGLSIMRMEKKDMKQLSRKGKNQVK